MTIRQKVLKAVYPALMWLTKAAGIKTTILSNPTVEAVESFYNLTAVRNDGKALDLHSFKGKKVLLVNTASDCGYTGQYEGLEKLYRENKDSLVVLGFPANDFKEQEKGTDENIAAFCKLNFGISFPLIKKSNVIKGPGQHKIYQWLTDKSKNGWNDQAPTWNFCKYLLDENGKLTNFFGPSVEPASDVVMKAIGKNP